MRARLMRWLVPSAALPIAMSCGTGDDAVVMTAPVDAGAVDAVADRSDAADADAPYDPCNDDWCVVSPDGAESMAFNALSGTAANDVWVVGTAGYAAHFDGTDWTPFPVDTGLALFSVWGSGPDDVWAVNSGNNIFHFTAGGWDKAVIPGEFRPANIVVGGGPEDVFVAVERSTDDNPAYQTTCRRGTLVSCPGVYRYSRANGKLAWRPAFDDSTFCGIASTLGSNPCDAFFGMWVEPDGKPWIVGEVGLALRASDGDAGIPSSDAGALTRLSTTQDDSKSTRSLFSLWGSSSTDVWAVGGGGTIRHYTQAAGWTAAGSPTHVDLRALSGSRANDVWAVGDAGTIVHYDGAVWTVSATPFPAGRARDLYAVWASPDGDVWVSGDRTLLRRVSKGGPTP